MARQAPGPKGLPLIGHYLDLRRDILSLMVSSREQYGDVVRFKLGTRIIHVINHPDLVRHVLVTNRDNYDKTARSSQQIKHLAGMSLLVSNGADWQIKRRLLQPAFKINSVTDYFDLMQQLAQDATGRLQNGKVIDLCSFMMHLTYRIVGMALLSNDLDKTSDQVEYAMTITLRHLYQRINNPTLPLFIPTPSNVIFRRERTQLRQIVEQILQRRRAGTVIHDLLNEMIVTKNSDKDHRLDDAWLRDEVVTLLLAGHETTANALSFCTYLLARYPAIQDKLVAEINQVLGARQLQLADLDNMPYLQQVFLETLRLYPPIWAMERFVKQPDELAGYSIPAKSTLFISIYAMHRHSDFWADPVTFDPERFAGKREHKAFMPFGLGPRMCLGMSFALQEAKIILVTLLQRFVLISRLTQDLEPEPGITLRARGELPVELRLR